MVLFPGIAVLGFGQPVVGFFDADIIPSLGIRGEDESRVAQHGVCDELRSELPSFGIAIAAAGVVLERAGEHHPGDRGLDEMRIGVGDPPQ